MTLITRIILSLSIFILLVPTLAHANAGLPMIGFIWPLLWIGFIPIVLIEWLVMKKMLTNISRKNLLLTVTFSNLVSTFIGIPIVWVILAILQMVSPGGGGTYPNLSHFWQLVLSVTVQAPWLLPYGQYYFWMVPTAFTLLMIPFFFMSYWIEGGITLKFLSQNQSYQTIKSSVWKANLYSYLFLTSLGILGFYAHLSQHIPSFISYPVSFFIHLFLKLLPNLIHIVRGLF